MTGPPWPNPRPTLVDHTTLLRAVATEGETLVRAAAAAEPDDPVPGCPGLTAEETVLHTGSVYGRALGWMRHGEPPDAWARAPDPGETPAAFHTRARDALTIELAAHDPLEPCGTWFPPDPTYGFWRRRMAHETTVHRVDVQAAAGIAVDPVAPDFAADGIDEVLGVWYGHRLSELGITATGEGAVGVLVGGRSWLVLLTRSRGSVRRVVAADARAADALVTGDPMSVYLWLWGRLPDRAVTITGDIDATAQLWALLRVATQ